MIRKMKVLGLAVVAIAAMSMAAASAAQASELHVTHNNHASIFGERTAGHVVHKFQLTGPNLSTQCGVSNLEGTAPWTSPNQQVTAQELQLTATYFQCTCFGLACRIDMNGCKYTITNKSKNDAQGVTTAKRAYVDITGCTAGKQIEITAAFGAVVTVPEQHNLGHIDFVNNPQAVPHDVTANITIQGIKYECHNVPGCTSTVLTSDGDYTGQETIRAREDKGSETILTDPNDLHKQHHYDKLLQTGALKGIIAT
jgi:hypothetical protein